MSTSGRRFLTAAVAGIALATLAALTAKPLRPDVVDRSELEGQWKLVRMENSGGGLEKRGFAALTMHFNGDKMFGVFEGGTKEDFGPFVLNTEQKPKHIDFKLHNKKGVFTRFGIYELDGDRLRICHTTVLPPKESNRPTDFATPAFAGRMLAEFTRVKTTTQPDRK